MITLIKQRTIPILSVLAAIYVAAWFLQQNLYLNSDVSWLLHSTRLSLAGKTYANDFFSPNPPVILFLYLPPVLISNWFNVKITVPFQAYIFFIATGSFWICRYLVKRIFLPKDNLLAALFLITLMLSFLVIPRDEFGQRDCLLLLLIMPYLLLAAFRMQGHTLSSGLAIAIGVLAAMGLAIKPQFLVVPILIESYVVWQSRKGFAWLREETLAMLIFFLMDAIVVLLYFPDFVFIVIPYIFQNYYTALGRSLTDLVLFPRALFCSAAFVFYFSQGRNSPYRILSTVLVLALTGLLIAYYLQHTLYLHHIIPAFSVGILLLVLLFGDLILKSKMTRNDYFKMIIISGLSLAIMFYCRIGIGQLAIFPEKFFIFLAVLFAILLYAADEDKNIFKITSSLFLIIFVGIICNFIAARIFLEYHVVVTLFILLGLFGVCASKKQKSLQAQLCIAITGTLLFSLPVAITSCFYMNDLTIKANVLQRLVGFLAAQSAQKSFYVLADSPIYGTPLIDYTDARLVQRYDCLWMVGGLARRQQRNGARDLQQYVKNNVDDDFFLNKISQDFLIKKPDWVFVDTREHNIQLDGKSLHFDFLRVFLENKKFRDQWEHYRYFTTLTDNNYSLQIYKRIIE